MNPKISWRSFSARRNISLADLCRTNNITSYEELVRHLGSVWVEAPSSDSEEWTAIAQKNYEKVKELGIEKIRKTGLHPDGRKLKANEDPAEVWESALAASYEQDGSLAGQAEPPPRDKEVKKKPAAPKKTSTRRKTTRTSTRKTSTKKKSS